MLTIYSSSENTSRLEFVARHLFNNLLGAEFTITFDKSFYLEQKGPCINYSEEKLNHGLQILPQGLLFETGIRPVKELSESEWNGLFCFFYTGKGDIPFDLFAAAFYLLTLYEENFPVNLDEHSRFSHTESLLFRKGVLETPVIDRWAYLLKEELEKAGLDTAGFKGRKYRAVSTYDIDHPFLYRNKGWLKNAGGALRDLLKGNLKSVKERVVVQLRLQKDPYMTSIQTIHEIQAQLKRPYYLFVLLGKSGEYGHKMLYSPRSYYNYLKNLDLPQIGLHPSYDTLRNLKRLLKEKSQLEKIIGRKIIASRQHFLRMQSPETFQELHLAGMEEDFTLAFAQAPGFRSGTAVPYFFYDLRKDETTSLLIRPTVMMDATLINHLKLSPEAALQKIKGLIDACQQSGGDYLSLWHNSNLAYTPEENPWIRVFLESYKYAISLED
ncbi:MAG: hypothetical protein LBO74_01310 [Candidatus Symbiothrix sp.]|jgi:hypothetical protein|nr:hypothetical protein [Candidatus Symbiothrix sp.]